MIIPAPQHYIDALERQRNDALNALANAQAMLSAQAEEIERLKNNEEITG